MVVFISNFNLSSPSRQHLFLISDATAAHSSRYVVVAGMTKICTSGGISTSRNATTCVCTKYVQVVVSGGSGGMWWQINQPTTYTTVYVCIRNRYIV